MQVAIISKIKQVGWLKYPLIDICDLHTTVQNIKGSTPSIAYGMQYIDDNNDILAYIDYDANGTEVNDWKIIFDSSESDQNPMVYNAADGFWYYWTGSLWVRMNNGNVLSGIAGENLDTDNLVYVKTDTKYYKAKADSESTTPAFFVVLNNASAGSTVWLGRGGIYHISGFDAGRTLYLSPATGGAITATKPTTQGHYGQIVGKAINSAEILLHLNPDYIEIG